MLKTTKIYGGWWIADVLDRAVRLVTGCTAPDMALYLDNFKARRAAR